MSKKHKKALSKKDKTLIKNQILKMAKQQDLEKVAVILCSAFCVINRYGEPIRNPRIFDDVNRASCNE